MLLRCGWKAVTVSSRWSRSSMVRRGCVSSSNSNIHSSSSSNNNNNNNNNNMTTPSAVDGLLESPKDYPSFVRKWVDEKGEYPTHLLPWSVPKWSGTSADIENLIVFENDELICVFTPVATYALLPNNENPHWENEDLPLAVMLKEFLQRRDPSYDGYLQNIRFFALRSLPMTTVSIFCKNPEATKQLYITRKWRLIQCSAMILIRNWAYRGPVTKECFTAIDSRIPNSRLTPLNLDDPLANPFPPAHYFEDHAMKRDISSMCVKPATSVVDNTFALTLVEFDYKGTMVSPFAGWMSHRSAFVTGGAWNNFPYLIAHQHYISFPFRNEFIEIVVEPPRAYFTYPQPSIVRAMKDMLIARSVDDKDSTS